MKEILIIQESFNGGGAEKVLIDLLRHWDFSRFRVTLLIEKAFGPHISKIPSGVEVLSIYTKAPGLNYRLANHFRPVRDRLLTAKLNRLLGDRRFDTIMSFMEGPALYIHRFLTRRAPRNITWVHCNMANNHWTRWLFKSVDDERRLYASMDAIAFVSHGSRDAFATVFGGLEQKFSVINNLIDIDEIARRADEETPAKSRFTIVNVGRLTRPKRQDRLIEVVAELRRRGHDCEAWIAGTGALEADLHALAQKLNVADSVKFLGFQPNPYPLIKVADVFLLTSDSEGYPLVVAEAMCLGKPVVSTPATGPAEMLADGAGLLTGFDAAGIADAVERVILDRQLAADMGRASLAAARRRFDPAATMARVYALTDGR